MTWALLAICIALCFVWNRNKPRYFGNLCIAIALIVFSILHVRFLSDLSFIFDVAANQNLATLKEAAEAKTSAAFWAIVVSAVVGGVGINLLSNWIDS